MSVAPPPSSPPPVSSGERGSLSPCGAEARRHDNDRYLTALFAPESARETVFALIALNAELARTAEVVSEPTLGLMRLQWWRDQIEACRTDGPLAGHPVLGALGTAIRGGLLSTDHLDRLIDARERDLDEEPFHTLGDLETQAEAAAAPLIHATLEALGVRDDERAEGAARDAAAAFALVGLLRSTPVLARRGRVILPMAVLERHGVRRRDVTAGEVDRQRLSACVAEVAVAAEARLNAARAARGKLPRPAIPALLIATIAGRGLKRLGAAGHDPFARSVLLPDPWRHLALAWAAGTGRF